MGRGSFFTDAMKDGPFVATLLSNAVQCVCGSNEEMTVGRTDRGTHHITSGGIVHGYRVEYFAIVRINNSDLSCMVHDVYLIIGCQRGGPVFVLAGGAPGPLDLTGTRLDA